MISDHLERRVLAANTWAEFNYSASYIQRDFTTRGRPALKSLVESLLIHDRIVIPTEGYVIVKALVNVFGQRAVIQLVESGSIRFVRVAAHFAYFPEGRGLVYCSLPIISDEAPRLRPDALADVKWALESTSDVDPALPRLVADSSEDLDLVGSSQALIDRTYDGFTKVHSADLDPKRLPLHSMSFVTSFGGGSDKTDEPIPQLLALAAANLEMQMMSRTAALDLVTSTPIGHALRAHEIASGMSATQFATFREITGVPDIGELAIDNADVVSKLIRLRESTAASRFRTWFHENCAGDPTTTARAYIDLLDAIPKVRSSSAKVIRFVVTNGLGLLPVVGPIVSALAGAIDTFMIDDLAERSGPKFFVNQLKQIAPLRN